MVILRLSILIFAIIYALHVEGFVLEDQRIFGGFEIDITEAPWTASVHTLSTEAVTFICGGSIISNRFVVTSAICRFMASDLDTIVRVGSSYHQSGGQLIEVEEFYIRADAELLDKNIGLILLAYPIEFSISAYPIALPSFDQEIPYGANCSITGWGSFDETDVPSTFLKQLDTNIWTDIFWCETTSPGFSDNTFCAGETGEFPESPCQFDSGDPLVVEDILIGVTIYPWGCAYNTSSLFISVASQLAWMVSIMANVTSLPAVIQ